MKSTQLVSKWGGGKFKFLFLSAFFLLLTNTTTVWGQDNEDHKCPDNTYIFTGVAEQTLCEQNPDFVCDIEIGQGTPYPKSSLLGTDILTGNVCVLGDFEVDKPLTFKDALVKINPGVTIAITPSTPTFNSQGSLGIDNSKLFACEGLWKGITVGQLSVISTANNSVIEDAEKAIFASGFCALYIQQTTFNRNRIGIELYTQYPNIWVPGPLVWVFDDNQFTCTAPLNGSTDQITEVGVKLINSYLYTFGSGSNSFADLKYGIYAEGAESVIGAKRIIMNRIKKDGIFMQYGTIKLGRSDFTNCEENGIKISTARVVNVSDTKINITTDKPVTTDEIINGIRINSFALGAQIDLNLDFFADLSGTDYFLITGIYLLGGNVGAGTVIDISYCNFYARTKIAYGIYLNGLFPESSETNIYDNEFDFVSKLYGSSSWGNSTCINSRMAKNNLHIYSNRFYPSSGTLTYCMKLEFSDGSNNKVAYNIAKSLNPDVAFNFLSYIDFQETQICFNDVESFGSGAGYRFGGFCAGVDFIQNDISGTGGAVDINPESTIGPKEHMGNKWFPAILTTPTITWYFRSSFHARCQTPSMAPINKFTVHTDQSIWNPTTVSYDFFSEYHPENIDPDQMNEFFEKQLGSPAEDCETPPGSENKMERMIVDHELPVFEGNPAFDWNSKRYLYKKLRMHPELNGVYAGFASFLSEHSGTNVGRLYEVSRLINNAFETDENVRLQVSQIQNQIAALFNIMEDLSLQIESTTDSVIISTLRQQKENVINQIRASQLSYKPLSDNFDQQKLAGLQQAQQANEQITSDLQLEKNEKAVNSIYSQNRVVLSDNCTKIANFQITHLL
jgi:hypothetical protein